MAKDIQERVGQFLGSDGGKQLIGTAVSELLGGLSAGSNKTKGLVQSHNGSGPLSGTKGLAVGAGAAALAPVAVKGIGKVIKGASPLSAPKDLAEGAVSKLEDTVTGKLQEKVEDAGGPSGILKDTVKSALPFGGGGSGGGGGKGKQDAEGVGKGRRMPVQQSIDIGLPIETVYNQWTQFEEWPKFMHRVTRASQEDPCKVSFAVKIWGKTKEFTADIETQRPNDRIRWKTSQGMNVTGLVVFRELGPNLTRVMLSFDVDPGSLIEKYARGARYVKRAARGDLHRFAAFIEMLEQETGAWRGVIEDGELVEDHDPSYDEQREYGSADELVHGRGSAEDEESDDEESDEDEDDESDQRRQSRSRRGGAQARRSSSSRSTSGSGTSRRTRSSSSGSGRRTRSSSNGSGSSGRSSSRSSSGRSSGNARSSSGRSSSRSSSGRSGSNSGSSGTSGRASSRRKTGGSSSSSGRSSGRSKSGTSGSSRSSSSGRQRSRSSARR